MKKVFTILTVVILNVSLYAQAPNKMSYQGIIRNSSNQLVINQAIGMHISILQGSISGTAVYEETHTPTTNANGLVCIEIGGGTIVSGIFDTINWANGPYFIKTETDPLGGTNYTINGTSQLLSVPFAFYAKTAENVINQSSIISIGDSIVLKDSLGVIRMVLNPNSGTFKMMNNDTVWYQMSVNSPKVDITQLGDGKYLLTKEENGAKIMEMYQDANLIARNTETEDYDGSFYETTKTEKQEIFGLNPNSGVYEKVREIENISTSRLNSKFSENYNTDKYYNNGQLYSEVITDKKYNEITPGNVTDNYEKVHYNFYNASGNIEYEEKVERDFKTNTYKRYCKRGSNWILMEENNDPTTGTHASTVTNSSGATSTTITQKTTGIEFSHSEANAKKLEYTYSANKTQLNFVDNANNKSNIAYLDALGGVNYGPNYAIKTNILGETFTQNTYVVGDLSTTGNTDIDGNLNVAGTKNFRIAHPTDTTKYLVHAAMESNEVLNSYSGNVVTDNQGLATVTLPDYFDKINCDFRYVLTVVGQTFAQAIVYKEIDANNQFLIKTSEPNTKVSWQVIAKRNDAFIQKHPFQDIIEK